MVSMNQMATFRKTTMEMEDLEVTMYMPKLRMVVEPTMQILAHQMMEVIRECRCTYGTIQVQEGTGISTME